MQIVLVCDATQREADEPDDPRRPPFPTLTNGLLGVEGFRERARSALVAPPGYDWGYEHVYLPVVLMGHWRTAGAGPIRTGRVQIGH